MARKRQAQIVGFLIFVFVFSVSEAFALFLSNRVFVQNIKINVAAFPSIKVFASSDTAFDQDDVEENFGNVDEEDVSSKDGQNRRLAFRFDIPTLPTGVTLVGCSLNLFMNEAPSFESRSHGAYRFTLHENEWGEGAGGPDEAEVGESSWQWYARPDEWATPGGDISDSPIAVAATGLEDEVWQAWDVTADCAPGETRSWLIRDTSEDAPMTRDAEYNLREDGFATAPYLLLTYQVP
ncbi:hypothetical protein HYW32_03590 [Candidatus Berkelbacteria bacterium]|nr:hypothetical protein [Candidatus Berkelbacteria bacterium]